MRNQLRILVAHEFVDMLTIFMILFIMCLSARYQLEQGDAIIDIANVNFKEDIDRAIRAIMYIADIDEKEHNENLTTEELVDN